MDKFEDIRIRLNEIINSRFNNKTEACRKLNIAQSQLSRYLSGNLKPGTEFIIKLSDLGININWLFTGDGEMFSPVDYYHLFESDNISEEIYSLLSSKLGIAFKGNEVNYFTEEKAETINDIYVAVDIHKITTLINAGYVFIKNEENGLFEKKSFNIILRNINDDKIVELYRLANKEVSLEVLKEQSDYLILFKLSAL